ncbi:MAG TPA: helix-turn-helix domain-containing protein [Rectinema sp.]|nr:helix-turn-helix domain-containing protein [Rectinema sp.]HRU02771.1 helix-turn-helix domain-containing protein [Rectinema sp.]
MTNDEFLTVQEAADFLKTTKAYVYKLKYTRQLPSYKPLGGKVFFKKSELESLFENSRIPTQTELTDKAVELLNNRSRV